MNIASHRNQARPSKLNLVLGVVRTILEYIAFVMGGTALVVGLTRGMGGLQYYDGQQPGFIRSVYISLAYFTELLVMPHIVILGVAVPQVFYWIVIGALLFAVARLTRRIPGSLISRVILAVISLIVSVGVIPFFAPVIMGSISAAYFTMFWSGLLGGVFGLVLLPRVRREFLNTSPMHLSHWVMAAIWVLFFGVTWARTEYVSVRVNAVKDPQLDLVFARWVPGEGAVREEAGGPASTERYLTDQELEELQAGGLTGIIRGVGHTPAPGQSVRFVIVMSRPSRETVDLAKPLSGNILYIQTQEGWRRFPQSAPTVVRTVRLTYAEPDAHNNIPTTRIHVDMGLGHPEEIPFFAPYGWLPDEAQAPLPSLPDYGSPSQ